MTQEEIKQFIADRTNEGMSLSQIQDALSAAGVKMRFMELRLMAAEIESVLAKKEAVKEAEEKAKAAEQKKDAPAGPAPADGMPQEDSYPEETAAADVPANEPESAVGKDKMRGKTTVTVSPIQRPGFVACGSVSFGSGASAEWFLDQTGRLALDNATGKPDQQDLREFQMELRKAFGA